MRINQFHSGTAFGDAITNQMLMIQKLLKKNGYESEIYAEHIPAELQNKVKQIQKYAGSKDAVLLVHHSMGIDCYERIVRLEDKKIFIYHNITPERFFEDENIRKYIRKGFRQAADYKNHIDYCIAASNYNRQELIHMGYPCTIDVMPVQISLDRFEHVVENDTIIKKHSQTVNFIFVGRVVWNKRQDDVIRAFVVYNRYYNSESRLFIIGGCNMDSYVENLKSLVKIYRVEDKVIFTGKVSEEDLKAYYKIADIFLCMSEHEGFGVPILEAMKMGVPVIAYRSCAVPETMDGAGILVSEKNYAYIGTLCHELFSDQKLYDAVIQKQHERIERLEHTETEKILLHAVKNMQTGGRKQSIQMQGPFETSYSLAAVNRKLAEALDDLHQADVSIYCTEGPGDYEPCEEDLKDKPHARALWEKSRNISYPDVTIRNMYPPRVRDVCGGLNFQFFGWEESVIPKRYIDDFNKHLSGIGTMSDYVTEKLIECGIHIPVKTMGCGVELPDDYDTIAPYKINSGKKIKFLHISSAFPRKGVDILLKVFYQAFTASDDVCLVLKTFPNPHNDVGKILEKLNAEYANPPEIKWINHDMPKQELFRLYKMADCYVHAARGEGFGLPVAEAMLAKVPVIVSPNSGLADFCNEETALLADYRLAPANTHITAGDSTQISMWAEPDADSLKDRLKEFAAGMDPERIRRMTEKAHKLISAQYTWKKSAERWMEFINETGQNQVKPKVAMVTTWNHKCGIAEYARMEIEASRYCVEYQVYPNYGVELLRKDEEFVQKRLWHSAFEGNMDILTEELMHCSSDIIHFQFNFGFFEIHDFGKTIARLSADKAVVITFHKTGDSLVGKKTVSLKSIVKQLNLCAALVVHQEKDRTYLEQIGIRQDMIHLISHGQVVYQQIPSEYRKKELSIQSSFVIGSYGFFLPHKGMKEVICAIPELIKSYPDIMYLPVCALHDSCESKDYLQACIHEAEALGVSDHVKFVTDYLSNDESMSYLQACDLMVMPYHPSMESASGAVRFCLAALRPTITTKQQIFEEFKDCVFQIDKSDKGQIVQAVHEVMKKDCRKKLAEKAKQTVYEHSWHNTAKAFYQLYRHLQTRRKRNV